jgi:hypothetical protein
MMVPMIATSATRPMVRPTAAPVLSPLSLLLPFVIPAALPALGGLVGVTVTVRTCPVTVSRDVTGVGVHVEDEVLGCDEVVRGVVDVSGVDCKSSVSYFGRVIYNDRLIRIRSNQRKEHTDGELEELVELFEDVVGVSTIVTA